MPAERPNPRGFALLIVLWSVVLLSLLTTGITSAGRSDLELAGNLRRAAAAQAAADGGVAAAVFHVSDQTDAAWAADGRAHAMALGAYSLTIRVTDENGKLSLNYAPADQLAALIAAVGTDPSTAANVAAAIVAWRAPPNIDVLRASYRGAGMQAAPNGGNFVDLEELGLVMGVTPALLARLGPHLSVYAKGPLNLDQADPTIQAAMRSLGAPPQATADSRPTVVDVTSDAQSPDRSRFIRHAVVSLTRDATGRFSQTLSWQSLPAP